MDHHESFATLFAGLAMVAGVAAWIGHDLRRFASVARCAVVLTLVVVVVGAFVRLNDAGLGCPDWPGCYGDLSPAHAAERIAAEERANPFGPVTLAKAWKEMIHRYIAATLGALIVGLAIAAWRGRRDWQRSPWLATAIIGVVALQGAFGAWTVTLLLKPAIVTGHLIGGLTTLALLVWLALDANPRPADARPPSRLATASAVAALRPAALAALALLVVQIVLGGWVSTNYAALACPDFPTCQGQLVPATNFNDAFHLVRPLGMTADGEPLPSDALATIHWAHRMFAVAAALGLTALAWRLLSVPILKRELGGLGRALLGLLALQITLGIGNVVLHLPLPIAVAHNAGAALLLLCMVILNHRVAQAVREVPRSQPSPSGLRVA